jgi:D-sedoheptulose 7-phosphate isomerase
VNYYNEYKKMLNDALDSVDQQSIEGFEYQLAFMARYGYPILVCGNGGSAAITEHMSCDHTKGVALDTNLLPFIIPLQSNVSLCTAIANDIGYEYIFSKQIEWFQTDKPFGVLIISSSGNSPNVINALIAAKNRGAVTMSMVGFDGGLAAKISSVCIHVKSNNYGIVEDSHQIIMHSMAQSIRIKHTTNKGSLKL